MQAKCVCVYIAPVVNLRVWHKGPNSVQKNALSPVIFLTYQDDHPWWLANDDHIFKCKLCLGPKSDLMTQNSVLML